jgi:beta-mannanase
VKYQTDTNDKYTGRKMRANLIKPPARGCYTGAFLGEPSPTDHQIKKFLLNAGMKPKIIMWFDAFVSGFDFPLRACRIVEANGGIPFIKFEPWSWRGKEDFSFPLDSIIKGDFDRGIAKLAEGSKKFNSPYFLSFGHEMNADWYPWAGDPEKYKAAFKHVFGIFEKSGATNHNWVFNPNVDPCSNITEFYPGDEFIDWVALDGFNWGSSQTWSKWQSFEEIFRKPYETALKMSNKPLMIGEFASAKRGGDKVKWITEAFQAIKEMNKIKAFIWFNLDKEADWRINSSEKSKLAFQEALKDDYFIG